jgi:hypothetical protein
VTYLSGSARRISIDEVGVGCDCGCGRGDFWYEAVIESLIFYITSSVRLSSPDEIHDSISDVGWSVYYRPGLGVTYASGMRSEDEAALQVSTSWKCRDGQSGGETRTATGRAAVSEFPTDQRRLLPARAKQ